MIFTILKTSTDEDEESLISTDIRISWKVLYCPMILIPICVSFHWLYLELKTKDFHDKASFQYFGAHPLIDWEH